MFGEDTSQIRLGHAPQVLATLRNGLLTYLRSELVTNAVAALRKNATKSTNYSPNSALPLSEWPWHTPSILAEESIVVYALLATLSFFCHDELSWAGSL